MTSLQKNKKKKKKAQWRSFTIRASAPWAAKGYVKICISKHERWVNPKSTYYVIYPAGTEVLWGWIDGFDIDTISKDTFRRALKLGYIKKTRALREEGVIASAS